MCSPKPFAPRQRGFTMIELMITVTVLVILSAVAYPTFMDAIRKGRRADAFAALALAMQAEERHRTNNTAYSESLIDLGLSSTSPEGLYALSVVAGSSSTTAYVVQASARNDRSQTTDTSCRTLRITVSGGSIVYSSFNSAGAVNTATPDRCWAK